MPWIHVQDLCNVYLEAVVNSKMNGSYNAAIDDNTTNTIFSKTLARQFGYKMWLPNVPSFLIKMAMGEMAKIVLTGRRVSSDIIKELGFKFQFENLAIAIKDCLKDKSEIKIFCSGGGIHNPLLMQHLQEQLPACIFLSTAETGINPDAKEAVLFALLANECVCSDVSATTIKSPGIPAVALGKISFPA